jgi:hypothetical protein
MKKTGKKKVCKQKSKKSIKEEDITSRAKQSKAEHGQTWNSLFFQMVAMCWATSGVSSMACATLCVLACSEDGIFSGMFSLKNFNKYCIPTSEQQRCARENKKKEEKRKKERKGKKKGKERTKEHTGQGVVAQGRNERVDVLLREAPLVVDQAHLLRKRTLARVASSL